MKPFMLSPVLILSAFVCVSPASAASDYEDGVKELTKTIVAESGKLHKQNLAVVDFTDLQGNVTALGRFLAEELSASLVMAGGIQVVDRNQLNKIFQEHSLSMLGISDPAAIKKVGKVAGADALITGSITEMADSVRVTAKVMATDTARVIAAAKTTIPKTGTIAELSKQGISKLTEKLAEKNADKPLQVSGLSPSKQQKFEAANFQIALQECRRESTTITCDLRVVNLGEDRMLQFHAALSSQNSRMFDPEGNVYPISSVALGNQTSISAVNMTLASKILTRAAVRIEKVGANLNSVALLEIVCWGGNQMFSVQFRDVPLSQ